MTEQTPTSEKKLAPPTPVKKKTSAYDQPFSVMKEADQITTSASPEPMQRPAAQSSSSDWRNTSTSEPEKSVPTKAPVPKKNASSVAQKKKKKPSTTTKKAKNEMPKQKGSAPIKKENDSKVNMDLPRSARPGHKVLPYVFYGLALFIGVSLILNIFCNCNHCFIKIIN